MTVSHRCLALLLVILALSVVAVSNLAYASPIRGSNPNRFESHPKGHTITGAITVTDPVKAYDTLSLPYPYVTHPNNTYANVAWGTKDGTFELTPFTNNVTWGGGATPSTISRVDIKIMWEVPTGSTKAYYAIYYMVSPSLTKTYLVTSDNTIRAKTTDVWTSVVEPNGAWEWADLPLLKVVFEIDGAGGSTTGDLYAYEVWASVVSPDSRFSVNPPSIIDDTKTPGSKVTYTLNVTEVYDLGGVEFKVKWNPNVLNITHPWMSGIMNCPLTPGNITRGPFFPANSFLWYNETGINDAEPTLKQYIWLSFTMPMGTKKTFGLSGSGVLVQIDFTVVGTGVTDIVLFEAGLGDTYAETMPTINEDGYFSNAVVPEFPLGLIMETALGISIVAIWWRKKRRFTTRT